MNFARTLILAIAGLSLAGCISIGARDKDETPTSTYTLHPKETAPAPAKGAAAVIVPKPELPPGLATQRIALQFGQAQMDYYAAARWSAGLDELMQAVLIQAARQGLKGVAVSTPEEGAAARAKLAVKITDFQPVYKDTPDTIPTLTVGLTVTVLSQPAGATETQFSVKKTAPAAANTLTAITQGLDALFQAAAAEAVEKAAPALRKSSPSAPAG